MSVSKTMAASSALALFLGCGGANSTPPPPRPIASLSWSAPAYGMTVPGPVEVRGTLTLTAGSLPFAHEVMVEIISDPHPTPGQTCSAVAGLRGVPHGNSIAFEVVWTNVRSGGVYVPSSVTYQATYRVGSESVMASTVVTVSFVGAP